MSERILVIDDDALIRNLVKAMLDAEGYTVELAEDGQKGVELLDNDSAFRVIILDVMMPGMNGLDVLTRLRREEHTKNIPVIMLTGEDRAEDIMAGYQVGADYYITKPFTREQLFYGFSLVLENSIAF